MLINGHVAFTGNSKHSLDAKGRLNIPADYRSDMGEECYMIPLEINKIIVYPKKEYEDLYIKLDTISDHFTGPAMQNPEFLEVLEAFVSNAEKTRVDEGGRIQLPIKLREHLGLIKDVQVIGKGASFEIWPVESWQPTNTEHRISFREAAGIINEEYRKHREEEARQGRQEEHNG